jgi:hypothetical protein
MVGRPHHHRRTRALEPVVSPVIDYSNRRKQTCTHIIANIIDRHQTNTGKNTKHDPQYIELGSLEKLKRRDIWTM